MNKSGCLQLTLNKPSSKQLSKIKQRLKQHDQKSKQFDSLCYNPDQISSILSVPPLIQPKQRRVSKKQLRQQKSFSKLSRSKSKHLNSNKKLSNQKKTNKHIQDLYRQLITVKTQYKNLKQSYNKLIFQKQQETTREKTQREQLNHQLNRYTKQYQRCKKVIQSYQVQLDRIKRETYKIIENQKYKNKKLEEILQEKCIEFCYVELMIAFLRTEIEKIKKGGETTGTSFNQSSITFLQNSPFSFGYEHIKNSTNASIITNVIVQQHHKQKKNDKYEEDSLSFSRDKSKQMQSIHSFLTNNDPTINNFTKKDIVIVESCQSSDLDASQCLTFQQRPSEESQESKVQSKGRKNEKNVGERVKSSVVLPPKNKGKMKTLCSMKKGITQVDQNTNINKIMLDQVSKKCLTSSHSSRQRKKTFSKKRKI